MKTGRTHLALALLAGLLALAALAPAGGAKPAGHRICGEKPGPAGGAFHYIKAWNIGCKRAAKVARKAYDNFCDPITECFIDPTGDGRVSGTAEFGRWKCKVELYYDGGRIRCDHPKRRLVQRFGA